MTRYIGKDVHKRQTRIDRNSSKNLGLTRFFFGGNGRRVSDLIGI
jgi:hypothetical protein